MKSRDWAHRFFSSAQRLNAEPPLNPPFPTSPTVNLFLVRSSLVIEAFRHKDLFVQCRFSSSTKEEKNIYLKDNNRLKDVYFYQYV